MNRANKTFEYQPLSDGGQEPRLEFGDLPPGDQVRGWHVRGAYAELVR